MPKLIQKKNNKLLANPLIKAQTLGQRVKGLIGRKDLEPEEVFWIPACPSIHTFFMKFPIDVVFTDKNLCIKALFENVTSGKILFGGFKSHNVFEMKAGKIKTHNLKKGESFYVES